MSSSFLSIKNFKHIFKLLNKYSINNYNHKLNFKNYKNLIGNTMNEIDIRFNDKLSKEKKNIIVITILKKIIDDKYEIKKNNFFELEDYKINNTVDNKKNDNLYQLNNIQYNINVRDKNSNSDITKKMTDNSYNDYDKIINNNDDVLSINHDNIPIKNIDNFRKNLILKNEKTDKDLNKNIKNINEDILIKPDEYKKTINKYIDYTDLLIDSRDINTDKYDYNSYLLYLDKEIKNIFSLEILYSIIPNTDYIINESNNILHIEETFGIIIPVSIPIGNYSISQLSSEIQTSLNNHNSLSSNYTVSYQNNDSMINNIESNNSNFVNFSGSDPYKLFDNSLDSFWESDLGLSNPSFFIYDFGIKKKIDKYSFICNYVHYPSDFKLEISNDLINWTTLHNLSGKIITPFKYIVYTFPNNYFYTRYVRFSVTNTNIGPFFAFRIHQMKFSTFSNNTIKIISDLTVNNQNPLFNLRFYGGQIKYNETFISKYKDNSIAKILGFLPKDYVDYSSYTSDNQVILEYDNYIKMIINDDKNLIQIFNLENNINFNNYNENYVMIPDKLLNLDKLQIKFFNKNNNLFNFNGIPHSYLIRIHHYNTNQIFNN